jgi:hypothetical protein
MDKKPFLQNPIFEDFQVKDFASKIGQYHETISHIFVEDLPLYSKPGKNYQMTFVFKVHDALSHLLCETFCDMIYLNDDKPPELGEFPDFPHP